MKNRNITFVLTLILIIAVITYFESSKPKIGKIAADSDIEIEKILPEEQAQLTEADKIRIELKAGKYSRAKELVEPEGYINIDSITIAEHIGRNVILVDFWTYSCINCQRTFPYLTAWHKKYKDDGLVIIGVHTPEFEFEKEYDNVVKATQKWGINYPVVQDNDYQTWRAYSNRYWPRKYLIDIDGFIAYDHIGEGGYKETEKKIQELLKERNDVLGLKKSIQEDISVVKADSPEFFNIRTPEIYFGYSFSRNQMGNKEGWIPEETIDYTLPDNIDENKFYLEGSWKNNKDNMELAGENGKVILKYDSKTVNLVAGSPEEKKIKVLLDNEELGEIKVSDFDLYKVFEDDSYSKHTLELQIPKGVMLYTFTFG